MSGIEDAEVAVYGVLLEQIIPNSRIASISRTPKDELGTRIDVQITLCMQKR